MEEISKIKGYHIVPKLGGTKKLINPGKWLYNNRYIITQWKQLVKEQAITYFKKLKKNQKSDQCW